MPRITDFPGQRKDRTMGCGSISQTAISRRRIYASALPTMILIACAWSAHAQNSSQRAKPVQSGSALVAEASKTFAATCAGCHGLDGRGGERGPNIATRQEV